MRPLTIVDAVKSSLFYPPTMTQLVEAEIVVLAASAASDLDFSLLKTTSLAKIGRRDANSTDGGAVSCKLMGELLRI